MTIFPLEPVSLIAQVSNFHLILFELLNGVTADFIRELW